MGVQPIAIPPSLARVLNSAGTRSGVDFDYLLQTAIRESSLNPKAKAPTSSATGLFQFIESTWLEVMKEEGPRLGYQRYADAITETAAGDFVVADRTVMEEILNLREDPQISADMAAAFTRKNGAYLLQRFGRMPSPGELYIAHFLGARGAEKLFTAGLSDPDQIAADLFPKQARANPSIFYSNGEPRTIRQVYRALVVKHEGAASGFTAQQLAASSQTPENQQRPEVIPSRFGPAAMDFTALFSAGEVIAPRTLMSVDETPQNGAFFTHLYAR